MQEKFWQVTLSECPHCKKEINITSISYKDLKSCIHSVILTSNLHVRSCRKSNEKKLTTIRIKESKLISEYSTTMTYNTEKILL